MFLTADALVYEFGINDKIAKFFVDREPPADNLYWKDKQLYLRPQPGYIFLPLIVDLFHKCGVSLNELLSEQFITVLEKVGHYSAREEVGLIDREQVIEQCRQLVRDTTDESFLNAVTNYLNGGNNNLSAFATPFKALHRGDVFLFSICVLQADLKMKINLVKVWFALITTLLLLDDSEDYEEDLQKGEENAFIESGSNQEGFDNLKNLLANNLSFISNINPAMSEGLHKKFITLAAKPGIKEYLNN